jgi:spore maturation protein CgeB
MIKQKSKPMEIFFLSSQDVKSQFFNELLQRNKLVVFHQEDIIVESVTELKKEGVACYSESSCESVLQKVLVFVKPAVSHGFSKNLVIIVDFADPIKINTAFSTKKVKYRFNRIEKLSASFVFTTT